MDNTIGDIGSSRKLNLWIGRLFVSSGTEAFVRRWNALKPRLHGIRFPSGAALIVLAVCFGFLAHRMAAEDLEKQWLKTQGPSARIWDHGLGSRSFIRVVDTTHLHRIMRTLPSISLPESALWTDTQHEWVVIYDRMNPESAPKAYRHISALCTPKAVSTLVWQPVGNGWPAFDEILMILDSTPRAATPGLRRRVAVDPRAIQY